LPDCRTAALIGRNGSNDWPCWPYFDSGVAERHPDAAVIVPPRATTRLRTRIELQRNQRSTDETGIWAYQYLLQKAGFSFDEIVKLLVKFERTYFTVRLVRTRSSPE